MISIKRVLPKTLPIMLIVFAIFTVSLVEHIQIVDGFSASAVKLIYELEPGETQVLIWPISNIFEEPINIEFYATGKGSEFLVFEKYATIDPKVRTEFDVFVIIPEEHPDNIEYHPQLFALKRGDELGPGVSGMTINSQVRVDPIIKIGDNPIFTPEPPKESYEIPEEKTVVEKTPEPVIQEETMEEKLARIQAANEPTEIKVDDVFEEAFEEEAVVEYEPEPEYIMEPVMEQKQERKQEMQQEQKVECDFIAMLLSWFGIGKC